MKCKWVKRIKNVELRCINLWPQKTLPSGVRNAQSHGPKMIFPGFRQNHLRTPRLIPDLFSLAILAADAWRCRQNRIRYTGKGRKRLFFWQIQCSRTTVGRVGKCQISAVSPSFPAVFRDIVLQRPACNSDILNIWGRTIKRGGGILWSELGVAHCGVGAALAAARPLQLPLGDTWALK